MYDYDVVVIGGGSAGFAAADRAVENEERIAMVEADVLGGDCPNRACVPTKIFIRAAEIMASLENARHMGISTGPVDLDLTKLVAYKNDVVARLAGDRLKNVLSERGVDLISGRASFRSNHEINVDGRTVSADKFIICTGSKPKIPMIQGLDRTGFITSREVVDLTALPESILILGGGSVAMEFAHIFNRFGVRTVVVESADRILPHEDAEISELAAGYARDQGIDIRTGTFAEVIGHNGKHKEARLRNSSGSEPVTVDEIMAATGRAPNVEGLNLEAAGVGFSPNGIPVDSRLETSAANIWACGDVTGKQFYTHFASYQGDIAGFNAGSSHPEEVDYSVVPHVIYCEPEVAAVGMTEAEARRRYADVQIGRMPYQYLGKSLIDNEKRGLVKLVAAGEKIIGGHIIGCRAGEIIHEVVVAMKNGMSITALADTIHAYPTFAEGVGAAATDMLTSGGFVFEQAA
jgi:pyruvate/2-oxoglutarate dehydrogenase complex dihydrolipoamide dehydrogenase (E3) component